MGRTSWCARSGGSCGGDWRAVGVFGIANLAEDQPGPVFDARPKLDLRVPETRHYVAFLRYIQRDDTLVTKEVSLPDHGEIAFDLEQAAEARDFRATVIVSDIRSRAVWGAAVSPPAAAAR